MSRERLLIPTLLELADTESANHDVLNHLAQPQPPLRDASRRFLQGELGTDSFLPS